MKHIDSSIKYGCIIVLLFLILLAVGVLVFIVWRSGFIPISLNPISDNSSRESTSSDPQIYDQDGFSSDPDYLEYTFLPFEFTFTVPADWSVEITEIGGDPPSQKCLTHNISSPGGFANIIIVPMCGAHGGGREVCPDTTVKIGDLADYAIGRYPWLSNDPYLPRLLYSNINREDNTCIGLVSNSTIAMKITANYNGPDSEWPRYLEELDKIVLSLGQ